MTDSKREALQSSALEKFKHAYIKASTKAEKDLLWNSISTPMIDYIEDDKNNQLITFLYRDTESRYDVTVYLDCSVIGVPFSENSQLKPVGGTDLFSLTLKLPATLRTTYTFLKLDKMPDIPVKEESSHPLYPYPEFTGSIKRIFDQTMRLHQENKCAIDLRNPKKISYTEFDNPERCFFTESILELSSAPVQDDHLTDLELITKERQDLEKNKRFFAGKIVFSETSLKNLPYYKTKPEDTEGDSSKGQRKYWIYLPPEFDIEKTYPFFLFLDGSEYLNTIPTPSILERMIKNKEIPASIAVFFEYSSDRRILEYYADENFTRFIADDFIKYLRKKHELKISTNPKETTIVGMSASGLQATHAGLTRPDVFGNVVVQSAALWPIKQVDLYKMVDIDLLKKAESYFCLVAGSYETVPLECRFEDGFTQAISILEANKKLTAYMTQKGIKVDFDEFIGGHNCVCYRSTLPQQLKNVFAIRLGKTLKEEHKKISNHLSKL
jgi:enterochelin esterase-like enzyme